MPIAAEHAFKEKSAKLLILLPLRTILKRTFQCETPCISISCLCVTVGPVESEHLNSLHKITIKNCVIETAG